jgi:hypothetical protein
MTESAGGIAAFGRFFDEKDEFVHSVGPKAVDIVRNLGNSGLFFKNSLAGCCTLGR